MRGLGEDSAFGITVEQEFAGAGRVEFETAASAAAAYRERRRPSVWATEVRRIAEGQSPLSSGRVIDYRHEVMPHCVEPMDAADDPTVHRIVLWWPIRDGKTSSVCLNILGRMVTDDPGNAYSVHPIKDDADRFSIGDLEPMIDACLRGYFVEKKTGESGRSVGFKKYAGGWVRIVNAGSLTKFRGTAVKVMLIHEADALDPEAIYKALGRTTGFSDAVIVIESTGTMAATFDQDGRKIYNSRIEEAYEQGDRRKWFCKCASCGHRQWLKYEQIKWPAGRMAAARYHCEKCDYGHTEGEWRRMVSEGKWYPTAGLTPDQEQDIEHHWQKARARDLVVRSYWRNGFNSLLPVAKGYRTKLHEFAGKGEAAKVSVEALKTWTQEVKTELWDPSTEGEAPPPWKPIYDRREDYDLIVPEGGLFLTAFVDCQLNRLEVGWRAWGENEESWGMDHVVLDGAVREPEVWQMLRLELQRKWQHESKGTLRLGMAFVDGGHYAEDVYRFFQTLARNPVPGVNGHCRASKGVGQYGHPVVVRKMMTVAKNLKGHHIGTWEAKDRVYERLRMEPAEGDTREGRMHYNKRYGEEFFQQLTVETVTITFEKGHEIRKYVNPQQQRNEALDIEVGNLAAFRLFPRNFNLLRSQLAQTVPVAGKAKPKEQKEAAATASRSGMGRGWNL